MIDEERFAASEKFFVEDYADGRVALRLALAMRLGHPGSLWIGLLLLPGGGYGPPSVNA